MVENLAGPNIPFRSMKFKETIFTYSSLYSELNMFQSLKHQKEN